MRKNEVGNVDIHTLINMINAYIKKAETYFWEIVVLVHKVDKLEE